MSYIFLTLFFNSESNALDCLNIN